jgi:hypothetical protein
MALAFLILAHKNAQQVSRLFYAIYRPEDTIVLHFDQRSDRSLHKLSRELSRVHSNVVVLRPRPIIWGGPSIVEVQQAAMAAALRADRSWDHFINLSGQDFPIKPVNRLEERLNASPTSNYLTWFDPLAVPLWSNARERLDRFHLWWPWLQRLTQLRGVGRSLRSIFGWPNGLVHVPGIRRTWPSVRYFGGSNHVVLSREACQFVATDPDARKLLRWLSHAAHPDEIFFQTVLLNSRLASTVVNTNFHAVKFQSHSPHPRTFRLDDYDGLIRSPMFFARKFDEVLEPRIIDRLERHLSLPVRNCFAPAPQINSVAGCMNRTTS